MILNLNDIIFLSVDFEQNAWIEEIWNQLIEYLSKLFRDNFPNELTQNEIWEQMGFIQTPLAFIQIRAEIFENKEFTSFKCRFILNLIKLIQIILKNTELSQQSTKFLFELMDNFLSLSHRFDENPLNRFILWKKGYFSDKESLPSLYIFEKNVFIAKFYYYKKKLSKDYTKIFEFVHQIF